VLSVVLVERKNDNICAMGLWQIQKFYGLKSCVGCISTCSRTKKPASPRAGAAASYAKENMKGMGSVFEAKFWWCKKEVPFNNQPLITVPEELRRSSVTWTSQLQKPRSSSGIRTATFP
jgi:hypothetical protein